ncbi:MAG: NAD-dependent epimerase/dehydratase family protein [Pseudomonadota bacterium]
MKRIFVTGTAGFIGFHLAQLLLRDGFVVGGLDAMTDYYDVRLKERRHSILLQTPGFSATQCRLEDMDAVEAAITDFQPDAIVHLAAQAGVRYSLEAPRDYVNTNVLGTFNIMEVARALGVKHLMMASTSSVYGANTELPFDERQKAVTPLTIYAATKSANEAMSHSYAHLYDLPVTMFRFFTVYGPWGRPDMALFKFTKAILSGEPIDIYNHGDMARDFTYVEDLVRGIRLLLEVPPERPETPEDIADGDSLSPVAPFRVVNVGNSTSVPLLDFVDALEAEIGVKAIRNYMPMQTGDVPRTHADATLLQSLTGYKPETSVQEGIAKFVAWYREYYQV